MYPGDTIVLGIVFGIIGVICLVLGYQIGVKKKVNLIAGFDPEKCTNEAGLARFMGIMTAILGVVMILYPWVFGPSSTAPHKWLAHFPVPVVIIIIVMLVGNARYERK